MVSAGTFLLVSTISALVAPSVSFIPSQNTAFSKRWNKSALSMSDDSGGIEQIEFKIFPDGRIEETVRGIRGNNCHKVTEAINEQLGEVVDTKPTEEMYEQEVYVEQTVEEKVNGDGNSGGWEGASSW